MYVPALRGVPNTYRHIVCLGLGSVFKDMQRELHEMGDNKSAGRIINKRRGQAILYRTNWSLLIQKENTGSGIKFVTYVTVLKHLVCDHTVLQRIQEGTSWHRTHEFARYEHLHSGTATWRDWGCREVTDSHKSRTLGMVPSKNRLSWHGANCNANACCLSCAKSYGRCVSYPLAH